MGCSSGSGRRFDSVAVITHAVAGITLVVAGITLVVAGFTHVAGYAYFGMGDVDERKET